MTARLFLAVAALTAVCAQSLAPSKSNNAQVIAPTPDISCSTCRTSSSITLDWKHDPFAPVLATFYNIYYRVLKGPGEVQDSWNRQTITDWKDVTVQVTVGCCTGCETDQQPLCKEKNLLSATVYEIVAESVNHVTDRDGNNVTQTNPSAALNIPTGQASSQMPRLVQTPTSTDLPVETFCSMLGVSFFISCCQVQRCGVGIHGGSEA